MFSFFSFPFRSVPLLSLSFVLISCFYCTALFSQVAYPLNINDFSVCQSTTPLGSSYTGSGDISGINPNISLSITNFQVSLYKVNSSNQNIGFIGNTFTVVPVPGSSQYSFSNNTPGAPDINQVGGYHIRYNIVINYTEPPLTTVKTVSLTSGSSGFYNFYGSTQNFGLAVNNQAINSSSILNILSCSNNTLSLTNFSGTATSAYRVRYLRESATGGASTLIASTAWINGLPPLSFPLNDPPGPLTVNIAAEVNNVLTIQVQTQNSCSATNINKSGRVRVLSGDVNVDFVYIGSLEADAYFNYGDVTTQNGENNPTLGAASQTDGFLSRGGTSVLPTWVGATQTTINWDVIIDNTLTSVVFDLYIGTDLIGTRTITDPSITQFNINAIPIDMNGAAAPGPTQGYFANSANFNNSGTGVLGKTFRFRGYRLWCMWGDRPKNGLLPNHTYPSLVPSIA